MDKEQKKRAAYRTISQPEGPGVAQSIPIDYTVRVSGQLVELQMDEDPEGEYYSEDESDLAQSMIWTMSLDTLKRLVEAAQWCIKTSEAFEQKHPQIASQEEVEERRQQELREDSVISGPGYMII